MIEPLAPSYLRKLYRRLRGARAFRSAEYWDARYATGGNSGAGSYGRLAQFKADFLNNFVSKRTVSSVVEFGCGDGNQLSLARYPSYVGLDVSRTAVERCKDRFRGDSTKEFVQYDPGTVPESVRRLSAELTLSLDVIYHLVEDHIYEEYMRLLFRAATRFVIVYASDFEERGAIHVRSRRFTRDVSGSPEFAAWRLVETVRNAHPRNLGDPDNTSMADFHVYERR